MNALKESQAKSKEEMNALTNLKTRSEEEISHLKRDIAQLQSEKQQRRKKARIQYKNVQKMEEELFELTMAKHNLERHLALGYDPLVKVRNTLTPGRAPRTSLGLSDTGTICTIHIHSNSDKNYNLLPSFADDAVNAQDDNSHRHSGPSSTPQVLSDPPVVDHSDMDISISQVDISIPKVKEPCSSYDYPPIPSIPEQILMDDSSDDESATGGGIGEQLLIAYDVDTGISDATGGGIGEQLLIAYDVDTGISDEISLGCFEAIPVAKSWSPPKIEPTAIGGGTPTDHCRRFNYNDREGTLSFEKPVTSPTKKKKTPKAKSARKSTRQRQCKTDLDLLEERQCVYRKATPGLGAARGVKRFKTM